MGDHECKSATSSTDTWMYIDNKRDSGSWRGPKTITNSLTLAWTISQGSYQSQEFCFWKETQTNATLYSFLKSNALWSAGSSVIPVESNVNKMFPHIRSKTAWPEHGCQDLLSAIHLESNFRWFSQPDLLASWTSVILTMSH